WGSALAAIAGTLTNTIGFLGISVLRGYLPLKAAAFSVVTNALPEIIFAVVIVVILVKALDRFKLSSAK
ncbi:MAG: ECF transporter S component, partial [Peptococcia bacterium]